MVNIRVPSVPHLVHIEMTYGCNSKCLFCYNPRRGEPFHKDTVDRIVASIYRSWIPHVYLIGGEPSILGVRQLNEYIEPLSQRSSVTVVTNGIICLSGLSAKLACLGIPIHGDEVTHERHTQKPGGYAKTLASFRYYVEQGFDVRCIPVLTAWNFDQMYEIIRVAKELGAESIFVDRFEDGGLGSHRSSELKPTIEQFRTALTQMIAARNDFNIPTGFGTAIPYCLDPRLLSEGMSANCGVGFTFAAINPDGDVRICNQSEVVFGNVLAQPIEEIWQKPELTEFRDLRWVTEPCRSCSALTDCMCGCKVDVNCSDRFCVDYAVRGLARSPYPVCQPKQSQDRVEEYPPGYRQFVPNRYARLITRYPEKMIVTRYQTIELDSLALRMCTLILDGTVSDETALIRRFSDEVEESEVRGFVNKLHTVGAIDFVKEHQHEDQ